MASVIKFNYLLKNELEYEATIRSIESDTVVNLKEKLNNSNILPEDIISSNIPIAVDLQQSELTLNYIDENLNNLEQNRDKQLLLKLKSFLNHLRFRLQRIKACNPFIEQCGSLRARFHSISLRFNSLSESVVDLLDSPVLENLPLNQSFILDQPNSNIRQTDPIPMGNTHRMESSGSQTPKHSSQNDNNCSNYNLIKELKSFNYNGETCPRSFIQKLEEFRLSRNISDETLLTHAFVLFSDKALHWFRFLYHRGIVSWKDLQKRLIKDFGSHDYDYELLNSIRKRTQGSDESIIIYISIMFGMFDRLTEKLSECEQLKILLRNIRPCYSVYISLNDISNIDDLIKTCQKYEKTADKDTKFLEPKFDDNPFVAEFTYRPKPNINKNGNKFVHQNPTSSNQRSFNQIPSSSNQRLFNTNQNSNNRFYGNQGYHNFNNNKPRYISAISNQYCQRCRSSDHDFKTCPAPKNIFCFKCGLKDYRITDCPNCSSGFSNNNANNSKN